MFFVLFKIFKEVEGDDKEEKKGKRSIFNKQKKVVFFKKPLI